MRKIKKYLEKHSVLTSSWSFAILTSTVMRVRDPGRELALFWGRGSRDDLVLRERGWGQWQSLSSSWQWGQPLVLSSLLVSMEIWDLGINGGKEEQNRGQGWDGWMTSMMHWTCVWIGSGSWWWTGKPGVLQSWGCKELDTTERLNWTDGII